MLIALLLTLLSSAPAAQEKAPVSPAAATLGTGAHRYRWVSGWLEQPGGKELGNTHGGIAFDSKGNLYFNTDTERAVMVYDANGKYLRSFGPELAGGVHGMVIRKEGDAEFLYLVHTGKGELHKRKLDGELVWALPCPAESSKYEGGAGYHPTGIAIGPKGELFVADGYGKGFVHHFDAERKGLGSFGGPGTEPGQFQTPHGIAVDTRTDPPTLLVADRENHRLQRFDFEGRHLGVIEGFRRPCSVDVQGEFALVADLAGRVTILNAKNEVFTHIGDNPNEGLRAQNGVPREQWQDGCFTAPHFAKWDSKGNLYVLDWNYLGRVTKLERVR